MTSIFKLTFILVALLKYILNFHYDLRMGIQRCIIEELFEKNMAMIKWKIRGLDLASEDEQKEYISQINLHVTYMKDSEFSPINTNLNIKEGKISFLAEKSGQYKICTKLTPYKWKHTSTRISMELVVLSDNMDEPNLEKLVKKEEVEILHSRVDEILRKGERYIKKQNDLIKLEDQDSISIMKTQSTFYYMTIAQIVVVVLLGVYQVINFKKYIDNNVLDF